MLDLIRPTSGRVTVFGLDPRRESQDIHRRIGYLPGELALYDRLTGGEYLAHIAALRGRVDPEYAMRDMCGIKRGAEGVTTPCIDPRGNRSNHLLCRPQHVRRS
jgi:hypothetical protein